MKRSASLARTGWVAGLNHGAHDAACALTFEGQLVVWIEQERLSRLKHAVGQSPAEALATCLAFAGITLNDLDLVCLGSDHDRLAHWLGNDPKRCAEVRWYSSVDWLFPETFFGEDVRPPPLNAIAHHRAHAASAFHVSGFDEAAALVMDAMGEDTSTTLSLCRGAEIEIRKTYDVDQSLGYFYETATAFAGFGPYDAGKLMGLSAYGDAIYPIPLAPPTNGDDRLWRIGDATQLQGRERVADRCSRLSAKFAKDAFPFEGGISDEPMAYRDFAASAQAALERVILSFVEKAVAFGHSRRLVMAGGVALNCAANGKVATSGVVEELFVQPASTDSGVALGAALEASAHLYGSASRPRPMRHAYWGLEDTIDVIRSELHRSGLVFEELNQHRIVAAVAAALNAGKIVAWHQGRAEVGPRALGARSLLGDPRTRKTVSAINKVKSREVWRPLAPSISAEDFHNFFDGIPNPFMIVAARVRQAAIRKIPAVVHVDGSARPQVVVRDDSPLYHCLLKTFEQLSGVPVLVNTSLNGKNEPICYSAANSISFFKNSLVDVLAIENFLVRKRSDIENCVFAGY